MTIAERKSGQRGAPDAGTSRAGSRSWPLLVSQMTHPSQPSSPQDHEALRAAGVSAIYGPGTRVPASALDMLSMLLGDPSVKDTTCTHC